MIGDGEIAGWLTLTIDPHTLINGGDVEEHLETHRRTAAQIVQHTLEAVALQPQHRNAVAVALHGNNLFLEAQAQLIDQRGRDGVFE